MLTGEKIPASPLSHTTSDRKLGRAWERGYLLDFTSFCQYVHYNKKHIDEGEADHVDHILLDMAKLRTFHSTTLSCAFTSMSVRDPSRRMDTSRCPLLSARCKSVSPSCTQKRHNLFSVLHSPQIIYCYIFISYIFSKKFHNQVRQYVKTYVLMHRVYVRSTYTIILLSADS